MERAEKYGLGIAAAGHVVLFGLLSVGFLSTPNPLKLESQPIDISLVDAVALESAAPATTEAPAPSEAPETGPPEDAAPLPSEALPEPVPAPPPPAPPQPKAEPPRPTPPRPAPAPAPKAPPARPEPAKAAPKAAPAPARPAPRPNRPGLARPDVSPERPGANPAAKAARPRGSMLGDDFRQSLALSSEKGTGQTPRAANVSAQAVAGLGDAIARQVQPCANRIPNPGPGANLIRSRLRLRMNPDGSLATRPALMGQTGVNDGNERYAQRVGELAAAAIIQCAPYELPDALYEGGWKDIIINYRLPG